VIVWSHGTAHDKCVEARQSAAWSFITRFNLDGWDVLRFDRDQCPDLLPRALSQMAASIPQLHDAGYRQIVLAGQSRGAWKSLQILLAPGVARLVSAVIGVAPARHGANPAAAERGWADWISLIDHLDAPQVAIALVFFPKDEYTPDALKRAAYAATALAKKGNPSMIVYEEEGVISGHGGGGNRQFTDKFSPCLIQFLNSSLKFQRQRPGLWYSRTGGTKVSVSMPPTIKSGSGLPIVDASLFPAVSCANTTFPT
jgi:hypothetical protein